MDIKEQISKIVEEISKNPDIKEQFEKEPVKAIEKVLGVDLPDAAIEQVINGVKAKLTAENLSQAADMLKKFF
ncbi:MAG: hypothetical protein J6J86_03190 [Lachnospiraceae bacterium]|nr:hypothetical protein [Lachnospiraceae bacterium]